MNTQVAEAMIETLDDLEQIVGGGEPIYLRYSRGYDADSGTVSVDGESGLRLPGLSVNPLTPEPWWTRPLRDWLARQVCQYKHLGEAQDKHPWIMTGTCVGRGPDCEPLLTGVHPRGKLHPQLIEEAERTYTESFAPGRTP